MRLRIEDERHAGTKHGHCDKGRQNPLRRVIGRHHCRADLDDKPRDHGVAQCDAINPPLFQLTEERVHLGPVAYRVSSI
jgi:hypothetical protein